MKVLAISSYAGLGGAELAMASFLAHRPPDVDAAAVVLGEGPLAQRLARAGMEVWAAPSQAGRPDPRKAARFARALDRILDERRPDVVWACGQKGALLSIAACRRRGIPLVWHKVDFSHDDRLARPLALAVNGVIGVSEAVTDAIGPVRRRRLLGAVGVPVALSPELRARPDPAEPVIGTLARLVPYKGIHTMISATALLRAEHPALRLVVAGAPVAEYPDYPDELRALVASLGLERNVELLGFVDDVTAVLQRLTVFVNATYRDADGYGLEGMPGSILEASWAGVPVVAPATGGNVEAVVDGVTGTLIEDPSPRALARAIAPYLRDHELAARTGEAAAGWARERFAPPAAARRLFDALRSVI